MRGSAGFKDLKELAAFSTEPELVQRFIRLVESEQGYRLYKAVSDAKEALSTEETAGFSFEGPGFRIESNITRADFESWIAAELEAIGAAPGGGPGNAAS